MPKKKKSATSKTANTMSHSLLARCSFDAYHELVLHLFLLPESTGKDG